MSPGRIAVIALVLAVIGGAWAVVALTGENRGTPDALLLDKARPEDPAAWQIIAEGDDDSGGPDSTGDRSAGGDGTSGDDGTSGGDTSVPAAVGGGGSDSSGGPDT